MILQEVQVVISKGHGGFSFDKEMVDWLVTNKGWKLVGQKDIKPQTALASDKLIADAIGVYYSPAMYTNGEDMRVRMHPDLIECVQTLQKKLKDMDLSFTEEREHQVLKLKVVEVSVSIGVEDYFDGYERVHVSASKDD